MLDTLIGDGSAQNLCFYGGYYGERAFRITERLALNGPCEHREAHRGEVKGWKETS